MSRVQEVLDRLEVVAKRFFMSIEDAVLILEGKHPTHKVISIDEETKTATIVPPVETVDPNAAHVDTSAAGASAETPPSKDAAASSEEEKSE